MSRTACCVVAAAQRVIVCVAQRKVKKKIE